MRETEIDRQMKGDTEKRKKENENEGERGRESAEEGEKGSTRERSMVLETAYDCAPPSLSLPSPSVDPALFCV